MTELTLTTGQVIAIFIGMGVFGASCGIIGWRLRELKNEQRR